MNQSEKASTEQKQKKKWPIVAGVVVALIVVAGIGGASTETEPVGEGVASVPATDEGEPLEDGVDWANSDFSMRDLSLDVEQYFTYARGSLKNNATKDYDYVQISFKTYDKESNVIGSCYTNISGLAAGETWKFEAICTSGDVASVKVDEVTGW